MLQLCHVVGTDEISTITLRGKPLTITTVDHDARDVHTAKQIVGIVGSVVARHLHLFEFRFRLSNLTSREQQRSNVRTNPDITVLVFRDTLHGVHVDACAVLVDEVEERTHLFGLRVEIVQRGLCPVVVHEPQQTVALLLLLFLIP